MSLTVTRERVNVSRTPTEVAVAVLSGQGPAGPPGAGGTPQLVTRTFAFGDAAHAYYTAPAAGRVVGAEITYRTAFNGAVPTVLVGTALNDGSILAAGDSDPKTAGTYGASCDVTLASGAGVWVTITPSGSSQGSGVLTLFLSFD